MKFKRFKTIEESISAIGLGCWGFSGGSSWTSGDDRMGIKTVHKAVDSGINFFDVAPIYGMGHAESLLGEALQGRRDKVLIASKCGMVWDENNQVQLNLTRESIFREIELSLKRLQTDRIDIYQMHWPDIQTKAPIEESFEALDALRKQGKIRYIGLTNFSKENAKLGVEQYGLSTYQGLYNLLEHNPIHYHNLPLTYRSRKEMLPFCREHGLPFLPYSPLMQGLLTEHFDPSEWAEDDVRQPNPKFHGSLWQDYQALANRIREFAASLQKPTSQLAVNWLVAQEEVGPVISGALLPEHVSQNVSAMEWSLDSTSFSKLEALIRDDLAKLENA